MDIKMLTASIFRNYSSNNYTEVLRDLDKYLTNSNFAVYDRLLDIYIDCQIKMGLFSEALKNLSLMCKLFPYYYNDFQLAMKYASCGQSDELNIILNRVSFSKWESYYIARCCFYSGLYEEAYKLFNEYLLNNNSNDELINRINGYLSKISMYNKDSEVFKESYYSYFKSQGLSLCPSHVVYVNKVRMDLENNKMTTDPKLDRRPYMIWKIDGKKIYAFPISRQNEGRRAYVLHKENYPNRSFDRIVKNNLVCLWEDDLDVVIDKIREDDYRAVINDLYDSLCLQYGEISFNNKLFVNETRSSWGIKVSDIILSRRWDSRLRKYYLILDINTSLQEYKAVELEMYDGVLRIRNNEIISLDINNPVIKIVPVSDEERISLISQLSNLKGYFDCSRESVNKRKRELINK